MQIRSAVASDGEAVHRLLSANGWAHRIAGIEHLGPADFAPDADLRGFAQATLTERFLPATPINACSAPAAI